MDPSSILGGTTNFTVDVAQLVEHQIVVLSVVSSILIVYPIFEILGSPVTPPALGAGELAGSNPAISTKKERYPSGEGGSLLNC